MEFGMGDTDMAMSVPSARVGSVGRAGVTCAHGVMCAVAPAPAPLVGGQ